MQVVNQQPLASGIEVQQRPILFTRILIIASSADLFAVMTLLRQNHLDYRIEHKHRVTTRKAAFRGLDPEAAIFLTDEGEPYKLTERRTSAGAISYSCDSLSQLFRNLHLQAGIEGASAMSGRRTFAVRLAHNQIDLKHIKVLLGMKTLRATKNLIDADPVRLGAIAAGVF